MKVQDSYQLSVNFIVTVLHVMFMECKIIL
jgi:hypothetical protein